MKEEDNSKETKDKEIVITPNHVNIEIEDLS